jgi:hypothetical protein
MHNPRMVDQEFEVCREIKRLTKKRNKTDEDLRQIARLEWYGGLYTEEDAHGEQIVVQPTSKLRKCLINTARISKLGKMVERALSFASLNVPLIYEGPRVIDEIYADSRFRSRLSVGVGNKRIMRVRPQFYPWSLRIEGLFIEDAGLNFDELEHIMELAGLVEGIGDNRVNGYGRFVGTVEKHL